MSHSISFWKKKFVHLLFLFFALTVMARWVIWIYSILGATRFPHPLEFREDSILLTTYALLSGLNPFAPENINLNLYNLYGILYNFAVYPLARIFGCTLPVHRWVSLIFSILSGGVLFTAATKKGMGISAASFTAMFVVFLPWARPETMGMFFFLLSIYLPFMCDFSWKSLFLSVILATGAFYSKIYFAVGAPYMAMFLFLFISKKKGYVYSLAFLWSIFLSMLAINHIFPGYSDFTLLHWINVAEDVSGNNPTAVEHLFFQNKLFFQKYWFYILLGALAFGADNFVSVRKKIGRILSFRTWKSMPVPRLDLKKFDKPLFSDMTFDFSFFCLICSILVIQLKLGRNTGAILIYYEELITPFLFMTIMGYLGHKRVKYDLQRGFLFLMLSLFVFVSFFSRQQKAERMRFRYLDKTRIMWVSLERIIDSTDEILNSPLMPHLLVPRNRRIYQSGHSAAPDMIAKGEPHHIGIFFSPLSEIKEHAQKRKHEISSKISNRGFDIVVSGLDGSFEVEYVDRRLLAENYIKTNQMRILMPVIPQVHLLEFWEPKD